MSGELSRRAVVRSAVVVAGAAGLSACEDAVLGSRPAGRDAATSRQRPSPTRDAAELAALSAAAGALRQLSSRYDAVVRRYPPLAPQVALARTLHSAHLSRLSALGAEPTTTAPTPGGALPKTASAALAELAGTEQRLAVTHSTAATQRSGETARLLAMIAASQTQLAITLRPKAATR